MYDAEIKAMAQVNGLGDSRCVCPFCSGDRKKKNMKDLSITVSEDKVVYMCHHCEETGKVTLAEQPIYRRKEVAVAQPLPQTAIGTDIAAWLKEERGISAETAAALGCTEGHHWFRKLQGEAPCLQFHYLNKGRVYASKLRAVPEKDFSANGAPQTLFNAHNLESWEEIIITEGEMDVLAFYEAEVKNAVSLPSGSLNKAADPTRDNGKLKFLQHHEDDLKATTKVIIYTDGDDQGNTMADEIARRIGRDRCWKVSYPEGCKDANDVLLKQGKAGVRKLITEAEPWPVEGLHDASYFHDDVMDIWTNGLARGENTGIHDLDNIYSVMPGQLTVVTGHPSNGKSELVDQIMTNLAEAKGWKFGVCSFENEPRLHIANLMAKYIGLPFFNNQPDRMSEAQRDAALKFVRGHFTFLHNDGDSLTTLDSIIERLRIAVMRHGIRGCVIDPYNYIAKSRDMSETDWVSEMLSRIRKFAQSHGIHVFFIAHPTKMGRGTDGAMPIPRGNDITGSAAFNAKADMGITVYRPDPVYSNETEVHVWKARYSWCGKQGKCSVYFNPTAGRFVGMHETVTPKSF